MNVTGHEFNFEQFLLFEKLTFCFGYLENMLFCRYFIEEIGHSHGGVIYYNYQL